jgi:hypothetical protein
LQGFWIAQGLFFILFIVLWDITHAVFLQLLASKEPCFDGVQGQ